MANKIITDLVLLAHADAVGSDMGVVIDVSDTGQPEGGPAGSAKRISLVSLADYRAGLLVDAAVSILNTSLALKAPLLSPSFSGTPTVPTATSGTNTTQAASTAFVRAAITALINAAPGALDTLDELAAALGDDANFATTVTNALAGKQPLNSVLTTLSSGDGSGLSVTATGTTTPSTLANRFAQTFNFLDFGGGFTGLQAALDAADDAGGGVVTFDGEVIVPLEDGNTTALTIGDNTELRGKGVTSVLKRANNSVQGPVLWGKGRLVVHGGTGLGQFNVILRNFVIDGNKGTATDWIGWSAEHGVWLYKPTYCKLIDLEVRNCRTGGIGLEFPWGTAVARCITHHNLKGGIYLSAGIYSTLSDCLGYENGSVTGDDYAISACSFISVSNCNGFSSKTCSMGVGRDSQFIVVNGGFYAGIYCSSEQVVGFLPYGAERPEDRGTYDGVTGYGVSHSVFNGCTVYSPGDKHGIVLSNGTNNQICNTTIYGAGQIGILLIGVSNTRISSVKVGNVGLEELADNQAGILITGNPGWPADGTVIDGCEITNNKTPSTMTFGVIISGEIAGTRVINTRIQGYTSTLPITATSVTLPFEERDNLYGEDILLPSSSYGTAAPTTGVHKVGERVWSTGPAALKFSGWVCTVAGNPGTWVPFGPLGPSGVLPESIIPHTFNDVVNIQSGVYFNGGTLRFVGNGVLSGFGGTELASVAFVGFVMASVAIYLYDSTGTVLRFGTDPAGNIITGPGALDPAATAGHFFIRTCAGVPTGTPAAYTGMSALMTNSSGRTLHYYINGVGWNTCAPLESPGFTGRATLPAHVGTITADTDGATVTFDLAVSNRHAVTLGGDRTLALSNPAVGQEFTVILKQDGTGSRLVTWWAGILWAGGVVPTLTTGAGKRDVFRFLCTATGEYLGTVWGQNF